MAAAAAAGAGAGIYLTSRGAESLVQGSVDEVAAGTLAAFGELQIQETGNSTERGGDERSFKGTKGELEVNVDMKRESPTTVKVEVTAKRSTADWDKDFAKQVLAKIIERS
ncbi:MAG: hypothetical protein L0099_05915 [Acidobacteria bacterium]|nr:hypothetical protein [Acidobacteriota bacterium]